MKRTLVLVFSIFLGLAAAHAQQQFATLQHGDSISVFYGTNALTQAHSAAVNGDIITLSPGSFSGPNITKLVTIRGAGMFNDTANGTLRTIITDAPNFGTYEDVTDSIHFLTMEGLYFINTIGYRNLYQPIISKCYFHNLDDNSGDYLTEGQFLSCIIEEIDMDNMRQTDFFNCVIVDNNNMNLYYTNGTNSFYNCVIRIDPELSDLLKGSFYNSILYPHNSANYLGTNYQSSISCIGISDDGSPFYKQTPAGYNLHNYSSFESVFKYFDGTYTEGVSFELQDSIASSIHGSDGTQVGIYGGQFPFDPRVVNYKTTVAPRSTADGKLEVNLQPLNEQ